MASRAYKSVPEFFLQDDLNAVPGAIGAVPPHLGLRDTSDSRWSTFQEALRRLDSEADRRTSYKLIIFGRHGEGFHNVGEAKYGTKAWDDYWSKLNGDGEIVWGPDPKLTALGEEQARMVNQEWKKELEFGMPLPSVRFCSPMTRAIQTYLLTFDGLPFQEPATIVEARYTKNCREEYGEHTCDQRHTRTWLSTNHPQLVLEEGFAEKDELWSANERESKAHVASRARKVLDILFDNVKDDIVSITAHGGIINGFLTAIGRTPYALPTGGVLPVVVESTLV